MTNSQPTSDERKTDRLITVAIVFVVLAIALASFALGGVIGGLLTGPGR